jgi:hypothetical protein
MMSFFVQICDTDLDLSTLLLEHPVTATGIDHCEKDIDTYKNKATCEASQSSTSTGEGGCCQWDDQWDDTKCRTKIGSSLCRDAKRDAQRSNDWFSDNETALAVPLQSWCFRVAAIGPRPGEPGGPEEPGEIRIPSVCRHTLRDRLLKNIMKTKCEYNDKKCEYNENGTGIPGNIAYSLHMDPQQFVESKDEWCLAFKGDGQKGACDCKDWWLKAIPDPVTFVWVWGTLVLVLWCLAALGFCKRREAGLTVR